MSIPTSPEEQPKSRNWLIIVVAVVVFCCLCSLCIALSSYAYSYGDGLFGLSATAAAGLM